MPGYLIWLNARLYEMKRLLKPTGSIYVHCDWHASHYIKCEMDKIFGYDYFRNEIAWCYDTAGRTKKRWNRKHDILFYYVASSKVTINETRVPRMNRTDDWESWYSLVDEDGRKYQIDGKGYRYYADEGRLANDWWKIFAHFILIETVKSASATPRRSRKPCSNASSRHPPTRVIPCSTLSWAAALRPPWPSAWAAAGSPLTSPASPSPSPPSA